jgi:ATP-dependent DNA helicase RecG
VSGASDDRQILHDLAALAGATSPQGMQYPALVLRELRAFPEGLLKRKLTENLAGWATLDAEERKARHARTMALLGEALRASSQLDVPSEANTTAPARATSSPHRPAASSPPPADDRRPTLRQAQGGPSDDPLLHPLRTLKGIGPKKAETLAAKGLTTVGDLLFYLPYRYENRAERTTLRSVAPGTGVLVSGHVLARGAVRMRRFPLAYRIEIRLEGAERVSCVWFRTNREQQAAWERRFPVGAPIEAAGELAFFDGRPSLMHPETGAPGALERGLIPVYSESEGLTTRGVRAWMRTALAMVQGRVGDPLPAGLRARYALIERERALVALHVPADAAVDPTRPDYPPRRRLVFEEFLLLSLGLLVRRRGTHRARGLVHRDCAQAMRELEPGLPFRLTAAQSRALGDIVADLESGHPMHRIVQGDVGSGKTAVALIAAAVAMRNGYQAALMAPTELLAEQHLRNAERFLRPFGLNLALLTGSTPAKARRELAARLQAGSPLLVVGTHALLEADAAFTKLALAIVDEQHRFGVKQRAELAAKGAGGVPPHFLVMSATPIPRTLAMTLYGDLDVSVIDELPPGRHPVETQLVVHEEDRKRLMGHVKHELAAGRQIYWVFPLIEESEKIELKDATRAAELLQQALPQTKVELLHGRLTAAEKDAVMGRFTRGESGVLVATTVIEVGVDVPNASLMVVEHADRFGLSQLHQLRGRVGRGAAKSYCYLRVDEHPHGDVADRLRVMTQTNDGFRIAEADLEIRGAGDLLGTKQSGLPSMHLANPVRDAAVLSQAREAAEEILRTDPTMEQAEHRPLRALVERAWAGKLQFTTAG